MLGYYNFDANADSSAGTGNDGIIFGATPTIDRWGRSSGALQFDGADDFIQIDIASLPIGAAPRAIALWAKAQVSLDNQGKTLIAYGAPENSKTLSLMINGSPLRWAAEIHGGGLGAYGPLVNDEDWHSFVLNVEAERIKFYVDGEFVAESAAINTGLSQLLIGKSLESTGWFKGAIDDLHVYARALSLDEVEAYHQSSFVSRDNPPRPNTFMLQSAQAGSTTDIDNLRIIDLDSGEVVYENLFDHASDATNNLNLFYWPQGGRDTSDYVVNGPLTRVENGKLRLETTGFMSNGSGGYESHSEAEFSETLPVNFLVEFDAVRLQWAGHFHFHLYYRDSSEPQSSHAIGGAFSTNRTAPFRLDALRMAASGSFIQQYGFITDFFGSSQAWPIAFASPEGSLLVNHRIGISLSNNVARFYLDGTLLNSADINPWVLQEEDFCSPRRAQATAQIVNGFLVGATITDPGCGYTNSPVILIQGGGGTGAIATAIVEDGEVRSINIANAGCCFTESPQIVIASPPFEPRTSIKVSRVEVIQNVVLGRRYVLEASKDLVSWEETGPAFIAESEEITSEFVLSETGKYFRIREVP